MASGLARTIVALALDEAANAAGIVPGAATGFGLISVGAYVLMAGGFVRTRQFWWLALPATLAVAVVWSMAMLVSEEIATASLAAGGRGLVGLVAFSGYFAALFTVGMLFFVLPMLFALGWLADRIPALRRRGVGDAVRRGGRASPSRLNDPR
jgi:hypothetical protein